MAGERELQAAVVTLNRERHRGRDNWKVRDDQFGQAEIRSGGGEPYSGQSIHPEDAMLVAEAYERRTGAATGREAELRAALEHVADEAEHLRYFLARQEFYSDDLYQHAASLEMKFDRLSVALKALADLRRAILDAPAPRAGSEYARGLREAAALASEAANSHPENVYEAIDRMDRLAADLERLAAAAEGDAPVAAGEVSTDAG
jgi:hypothetical protein